MKKLKNKIHHFFLTLRRYNYNFRYLFGCLLRKILLSFILNERNLFIHRNGYSLYYKNEPFLNTLFVNPKMLREDELFIGFILKKGSIYIDVGANIGTTTICASKIVGETGKVFAFEPHIKTYLLLKKNIFLNKIKNVTLHNLALGDKEEDLFISNELASDINHLIKKGDILIKVKTLDSIVPDIVQIDLLKVDVEGFEEAVFNGAKKTLEKTKMVFFESYKSQYDRYGYSFNHIFNLLKSKKFNVYHISFIEKQVFFEEILTPDYFSEKCENIFASKMKMPKSAYL
jgi:FkbM family methyltransferase